MNRSGIKRGLAVSAVSALALSGLAATAQAQTILDGEDQTVELYSQVSGDIGVRNDGTNTTVTLAAASDDSTVNSFVFYSEDGGVRTELADVAAVEGYGTFQWTPPVGTELDDIDEISVDAERNDDSLVGTDSEPIATTSVANNDVVNLSGNDGAPLGVYDGRATITGLATDPASTEFEIAGPTSDEANEFVVEIGDPTANGTPVAANVAVGANDTADALDDVIARGQESGDSDDVQVYEIYDQVITNAVRTSEPGFPINVGGFPTGEQAGHIITVTDQNGAPITGAQIYESDESGTDIAGGAGMAQNPGGGTFNDDVTDELGQLTLRLNEDGAIYGIDGVMDQNPAAGVGSTFVVVDEDQDGNFDNGVDQIIELTISSLPVAVANLEIISSLGNAMDDDEDTDITVLATDAAGDPIQDLTVSLEAARDVADDSPVDATENFGSVDTNNNGVANFGSIQPGIDNNQVAVTFTATAGGQTGTLAIETDEAEVVWDSGESAQALANTDTTQSGKVQLPSGTPLPNRHVEIDLFPTDNTLLSPADEQPAGTVRGSDVFADATTDATGSFAVKIDDPAAPVGQELDNVLTATFDDSGDFPSDNLDLDWLRNLTPARVEILNDIPPFPATTADGLRPVLDPAGDLIPGGLGAGQVVVYNSDDTALDGITVNLTIAEGNFVDLNNPFEPTPAIGAPVDFASVGKTVSVTTGDETAEGAGLDTAGLILANIERHEGFDDDGLVDDEITAVAGAASDEHDLTWTTRAVPLNPRATNPLVVELSADQESSILPKARAGDPDFSGQVVNYDVATYDQFGNRTEQGTTTTDSNPIAGFFDGADSEFDLEQPAIEAFSPSATNQSLEVELEGPLTTTYFDDVNDSTFDPANPLDNIQQLPVVVEQNTAAINWYNLDLNASEFSLGQAGPNTVPVGTTVTEVFTAVDNEGQYLGGLIVDFLRAGPGNEDDDSCAEDALNLCPRTNANGKAFLDFAGGSPGAANVSVVVYEDDGTRFGQVAADTVRFGGQGPKSKINPSIKGKNNGGKADRVKVRAKKANGATVQLYKFSGGVRSLVQTKKMNQKGVVVFTAPDLNGNRVTVYKAVVRPTGDTQRGATQRRQIR